MKLVHKNTGYPVQKGDTVLVRGEPYVVTGWREPHKPSSTGRVYANEGWKGDGWSVEFFPSVFNMEWKEE